MHLLMKLVGRGRLDALGAVDDLADALRAAEEDHRANADRDIVVEATCARGPTAPKIYQTQTADPRDPILIVFDHHPGLPTSGRSVYVLDAYRSVAYAERSTG